MDDNLSHPFRFLPSGATSFSARASELWLADESDCVTAVLDIARVPPDTTQRIRERATELVHAVRRQRVDAGGIDAFLREYDLSSQEGVVLMCLAEALLRIPDAATADRLIEDKLRDGRWEAHLGASRSLFVNASTWALMLAGRVLQLDDGASSDLPGYMARLVSRAGEPVVRQALLHAMRVLGRQFVMGRTIDEALKRSRSAEHRTYLHSFDMLGEAALTADDAQRHFDSYMRAIEAVGRANAAQENGRGPAGVSVKLSALHARYEVSQWPRVRKELAPRLLALAERARDIDVPLTVDAEESERLDLSLDLFETVARTPSLENYAGLGLAVQAYQKRAIAVVDWVIALAGDIGRRIPLRLVKGAYWDAEIKRAQERGLPGYPVFTRKASTDVSYLACARRLLQAGAQVYPMFATHNAHTIAAILEMSGTDQAFEFQRLHGMGEELYREVLSRTDHPCRVYAPVGSHEELLPYLVRRLLENGANTSFVHRIVDPKVPVEAIVADPVAEVDALASKPHPRIPLPRELFAPRRANSRGFSLADPAVLAGLEAELNGVTSGWTAAPVSAGEVRIGASSREVRNPADLAQLVGTACDADADLVDTALATAHAAQAAWDLRPASARAAILRRAADLFERDTPVLLARCIREAGRTLPDATAELREAVDFLRYYAQEAEDAFGQPLRLPGPTGEANELWLEGRGVFACVSPWNFPLSIFTGQIAAALAAGNAVLAKPAEQTTLTGAHAVRLLLEAGVPGEVLHFLPGPGTEVGARLVADPRVGGVAFTGSTETARAIHRALAQREGPLAALIAETGGQNAMIADSSALPEQVVLDALSSAFNSAGQRCSALRVLFVQDEIAERVLALLAGAMDELVVGDPAVMHTDIGPVIDEEARDLLGRHVEQMRAQGAVVRQLPLPQTCSAGTFFPPTVIEIPSLRMLQREVFGPILHVVRFAADALDDVVDSINATGYGLTLGIHSRIESQVQAIQRRCRVGNVYVNRNMIGAVVGVQPFGGRGLSGTGPKAGGPGYLHAFASERTVSINTAAVGGNASLLALGE
jgi:RHH-type transcriptional regulator, proline utilization regulon repressor / proline dehydrogenase / delta 1-pyrroline-5-carboxylate dehydrogenase